MNQRFASFSPDGRWFAYTSTEIGGRMETFVQPFPPTGAKYQISTEGRRTPVWAANGRELLFDSANRIVAVELQTAPASGLENQHPYRFNGLFCPARGEISISLRTANSWWSCCRAARMRRIPARTDQHHAELVRGASSAGSTRLGPAAWRCVRPRATRVSTRASRPRRARTVFRRPGTQSEARSAGSSR